MDFPYSKILKQAYEITSKHKFLWILGLFLIWSNIGFLPVSKAELMPDVSLGLMAVALLFLILNYRAKIALIVSVKGLLDKQEVGLGKGLKVSKPFYLRALGAALGLSMITTIIFLILASPVFYLYHLQYEARAATLSVLALLIFAPLAVIMIYLNILSANFIALFDLKIMESIKASYNLIAKKWTQLIIFSILLWFRILIAFFATVFMVFLTMLVASYFASPIIFGIGVFVSALIFFSCSAVILAFHQTSWTVAFLELVKPVKFMDPQIVPAPEVAS